MFVPIVREVRDDGVAAGVGVTVSGVITIEVAGAGAHRAPRYRTIFGRSVVLSHPFFLPTSTFSDHPQLSLDLCDTPRDAVQTSSFVRITRVRPSPGPRRATTKKFQV